MKPLFKYWGGKRRICDWVLSHFPANYEKLNYIEPFCGSAVLFFAKYPSKWELINDADQALFCLFKAVRERPSKLFNLLKNTLYSQNELIYSMDILSGKIKTKDYTLIAWAKFVQLELCFLGGSKGCKTLDLRLQRKSNIFFNKKIDRQIFDRVRDRLKLSQVTGQDYNWCIKNFDSEDSFFYLDPPYPETDLRGYEHKFTIEDFNKLTERLKTIKGKYLLSFELKPEMECNNLQGRYLFKKTIMRQSKTGINDKRSKNKERPRDATECLLSNYKPEARRQMTIY